MSKLAAEFAAAIRTACGTIDPTGYKECMVHWDDRMVFRALRFDPTTGCFTVVRSTDTPAGAVALVRLMERDVFDPRQRMPAIH